MKIKEQQIKDFLSDLASKQPTPGGGATAALAGAMAAAKNFKREMRTTFIRKNADYGSAFRFWGIPGLVVRIGDKYLRLVQLSQKEYKRKIKDEKIPNTALDLANYGIMLLMLLDEGGSLRWGE